MADKGSSSKGKGMPGPPSRGTLLFSELLEISEDNYEQQMLATVSLFEFHSKIVNRAIPYVAVSHMHHPIHFPASTLGITLDKR